MAAEAESYPEVLDALRAGTATRLDLDRLELPSYARVLMAALIAALSDEPEAVARRPAAFEAFWAGRPPTLDNARVQYGGILAPCTTPDLRWIYKECSWDLGYHDPADAPRVQVLQAIQLVARQELEARMASLEVGPEDTVLDTAWRNGFPTEGAKEREAARRAQLVAVCVAVGLVVGALEFLALTWDASLRVSRHGIVTHLSGAGPLLHPLPAAAAALLSGVVAGKACQHQLEDGWSGLRLGRVRTPQLLALFLLVPAFFLGWRAFAQLKLLLAIALPVVAAYGTQKLYVPPRSNVAIPPRDTMKS